MSETATRWTRVIDGTTYTVETPEISPGVHHVSAELLAGMLRELGLTPVDETGASDA